MINGKEVFLRPSIESIRRERIYAKHWAKIIYARRMSRRIVGLLRLLNYRSEARNQVYLESILKQYAVSPIYVPLAVELIQETIDADRV